MVPFAMGSETAGSITYPAARCGVTALRPIFGAVGRTGVLSLSESLVVDVLKSKGVKMVPFKLNYTVESAQGILNVTMDVDMLAYFDNWQRSGKDDEYEAQDQWPTELRRARVIPAVDYVKVHDKEDFSTIKWKSFENT